MHCCVPASNQKQSHPADDLQSLKQVRLHGLDKSFVCINIILLGKGGATKSDEFSEKFQRGGGSFSIQKFILQILDLYIGLFRTFSEKNCTIILQK